MTYNGEVDAVIGGVVMMLKGENNNEVVNRIKKNTIIQKNFTRRYNY